MLNATANLLNALNISMPLCLNETHELPESMDAADVPITRGPQLTRGPPLTRGPQQSIGA